MYEHLQTEKLTDTIQRLHAGVRMHFPDAGLTMVVGELVTLAERTEARIRRIRRANLPLRALVALLLMAVVAIFVLFLRDWLAVKSHSLEVASNIGDLLQSIEAVLGSMFFLGAGVVSVLTLERRLKRNRALHAIHELRAMAHIVDLHQLQKDPDQFTVRPDAAQGADERVLTRVEMSRYLDFCSESLSLISNVAALYTQGFTDPVVLAAVDDIQHLTNGLSAKIWQKIMILDLLFTRGHS